MISEFIYYQFFAVVAAMFLTGCFVLIFINKEEEKNQESNKISEL